MVFIQNGRESHFSKARRIAVMEIAPTMLAVRSVGICSQLGAKLKTKAGTQIDANRHPLKTIIGYFISLPSTYTVALNVQQKSCDKTFLQLFFRKFHTHFKPINIEDFSLLLIPFSG